MDFTPGSSITVDGVTIQKTGTEIAVKDGGVDDNKLALDLQLRETTLQAMVEVIRLDAAATITPGNYDRARSDFFSDSTGYGNSIDTTAGTGNTDATFETNKYEARFVAGGATADATGKTTTGNGSDTGRNGFRITLKVAATAITITKATACTATRGLVYSDAGVLQGSAAFVADDATITAALPAANYWVECDASGGSYTFIAYNNGSVSGTNIDYIDGAGNEATSGTGYNIISISTTVAAVTVRTVRTVAMGGVLDGSMTQLVVVGHGDTLPTGTTLTWEADINNDGTYEVTGGVLGTASAYVGTWVSGRIRFRFSQGSGASSDEPSLDGFTVLIWN